MPSIRPFNAFIFLGNTILVLVLTVLTQVGGIALLLSLFLARRWSFKGSRLIYFTLVYMAFSFFLVPQLAPFWGRVRLTNVQQISPTNAASVLLNRNYVNKEFKESIQEVAEDLPPDVRISYLDACFPFLDGFPLLPHLSHNDGLKLDISFMYQTMGGRGTLDQPSRSGYGHFTKPMQGEVDQSAICESQDYWQYSYSKYLTFGTPHPELIFDVDRTRILLLAILEHPSIEKVFIEPHLVARMQISHPKIRFHGCHAVRHDDHIHIQMRPK